MLSIYVYILDISFKCVNIKPMPRSWFKIFLLSHQMFLVPYPNQSPFLDSNLLFHQCSTWSFGVMGSIQNSCLAWQQQFLWSRGKKERKKNKEMVNIMIYLFSAVLGVDDKMEAKATFKNLYPVVLLTLSFPVSVMLVALPSDDLCLALLPAFSSISSA